MIYGSTKKPLEAPTSSVRLTSTTLGPSRRTTARVAVPHESDVLGRRQKQELKDHAQIDLFAEIDSLLLQEQEPADISRVLWERWSMLHLRRTSPGSPHHLEKGTPHVGPPPMKPRSCQASL